MQLKGLSYFVTNTQTHANYLYLSLRLRMCDGHRQSSVGKTEYTNEYYLGSSNNV